MTDQSLARKIKELASRLEGELRYDHLSKILYATDASAYREMPQAVALPASKNDILILINFARENRTSLIPRGAGTSLAGQVVGNGIVVDVSRNLNKILEINTNEKWVKVEPGVILAELNDAVKPFGLQFGPETSTANRCTMGGMLGNNSCGLHSLVHGSVREHVIEVTAFLSDGSEVVFGELSAEGFSEKLKGDLLESKIYQQIFQLLSLKANRDEIQEQYPDPSVPRRNNGYALDLLAQMQPFYSEGERFNFAKLIAGSEGTLTFVTEMKLNLVPLPPKEKMLLCVHFNELSEAFRANLIGLKYNPSAIELMDKTIMDITKTNIGLRRNRFFIDGEPAAILIIELWDNEKEPLISTATSIEAEMKADGLGYHFPLIWGADIPRVWGLRTAGLGVLSNLPGDAKPVSVIEDTAIPVEKLPEYLGDFQQMMKHLELEAVYHGHIATGELHLRPMLNLKDKGDVERFRIVAVETAKLVKKYRGSLSGEHGDGRLRGEFIPFMLGEKVYQLLKEIKKTWDPANIFNPGKIIDTPAMNQSLRYEPGVETLNLNSYFEYRLEPGMVRAIEKCNGSGDCLKPFALGGTMCPSYMATRDEMHSTRGRANVLRELITRPSKLNWADQHEVFSSLDLCLSCKACKSECPSGVDMTKLKADFLQNHYDGNPIPFRSKVIAHFPGLMKMASAIRPISNLALRSKVVSPIIKLTIGFTQKRPLPVLSKQRLTGWYKKPRAQHNAHNGRVYLFNDEFLDVTDSEIGIKAILLLENLGYEVVIPKHTYSGRTYLSKGFVKRARKLAEKNIDLLKGVISPETPLIGIEPSSILTFRDEYPELVSDHLKEDARKLATSALMFDEFIVREVEKGKILSDRFTTKAAEIKLHGHCHQKALATTLALKKMLQLPVNYSVTEIPSGCCGMAGSFGYEKEHYGLSMQIGEMVLFPAVRKAPVETIIAAPGTSCREQIKHGTGREALHPVEILYGALL
jgi:FAD/FMN-containing dehydrogenase/Fe-S oxidoreductase